MAEGSSVEISFHAWLRSNVGKELSEGEARELFMMSRRERFAQGESLFVEGGNADALFLVIDGEVEIIQRLDGGGGHILAVHGAGSVVGETSLLTLEQRSATARVRSEGATVLRVARREFQELLASNPAVAFKLLHALAVLLAERLHTINRQLRDLASQELHQSPHERLANYKAVKLQILKDWSV